MKKFFRIAVCSSIILVFPLLAAAATTCTAEGDQNCFKGLTAFPTLTKFVAGALKALVMIAIPVIGFFIVVVGFKFIAAQGNPGKLAEARKNFLYVIIGAGLVLGAWVLATLIGATVSQLTSPSTGGSGTNSAWPRGIDI